MGLPRLPIPLMPPHLCWEFLKNVKDAKTLYVVAGTAHTVPVHWNGTALKGCKTHLTAGKLRCGLKAGPCPSRWVSYVPLIRCEDKRRIVVMVGLREVEKVTKLPHGTVVQVRRGATATAPVQVNRYPLSKEANEIGEMIAKRRSEDIGSFILHLWQDRELTEWCGITYRASRRVMEGDTVTAEPTTADQPAPLPRLPVVSPTLKRLQNVIGDIGKLD